MTYADQATELITWVRSKTMLLAELRALPNTRTVIRPVLTRWTAHLCAYKRILELRLPLLLCIEEDERRGEGKKFMVTGNSQAKRKAETMIVIIKDPVFWHSIMRMVRHLGPLGPAANVIQAAFCRLDTVLLSFGYLVFKYTEMRKSDADDVHGCTQIIDSLERRWVKTDQKVFIAAIILNPIYKQTAFRPDSPFFSFIDIVDLFVQLWSRFNGGIHPPAVFCSEIRDYLDNKGRFSRINQAVKFEVDDAAASMAKVFSSSSRTHRDFDPMFLGPSTESKSNQHLSSPWLPG